MPSRSCAPSASGWFNVKLSAALDALAAVVPGAGAGGPLFVVAFDDVDLNPLRCLETLKLLHLLSVPRVFTIVLGDMDMVELALNLKHSGDFSALVGHHTRQNLVSIPARDVATKVGELSVNAMRKLLPPAQRIRLRTLTRAEALNFRPLGMERTQVPKMQTLLDRCPVVRGTVDPPTMAQRRIDSLRDFLLYPSPEGLTDKTDITESELNQCTYTASRFLSMSPRRAADWWFLLKEVHDRIPLGPESGTQTDEKPGAHDARNDKFTKITDLFGRHCRSMIAEEPTLTPFIRRRFRQGLRRTSASGGWELSFAVGSIPETGPRAFLSVQDENALYPFQRYIVLQQGHGWRLHEDLGDSPFRPATTVDPFEFAEDLRKRLDRSFSAPTTWGLILLYDLLSLDRDWEVSDKLWIRRPLELGGFSQWNIDKIAPIWVAWPVPNFLSFWEHDIFRSYWNTAVKRILKNRFMNREQVSIEACVYAWLDAGAAVLVRETPLWNSETSLTSEYWTALIDRLAKDPPKAETAPRPETQAGSATDVESVKQLAERIDLRGIGAAFWLVRLSHFLWPAVSGIQRATADRFFSNPGLRAFWHKKLPTIGQYVRDILKSSKEKGLNDEDVEKLRKDWEKYRSKVDSGRAKTSKPEPPPPRNPRRPR